MVAAVVTDSVPLCYGVGCAQHANCKRYSDVEGSDAISYIATCEDGGGERPLYLAMQPALQREVA